MGFRIYQHRVLLPSLCLLALGGCKQNRQLSAEVRPVAKQEESVSVTLQRVEWQRSDPQGKLKVAAQSTDPTIRRRAVLAAGRAGIDLPAKTQIKLLDDADVEVRRQAAFAQSLGEPTSVAAAAKQKTADWTRRIIVAQLDREKDRTVKAALFRTLGWVGSDREVPLLVGALKSENAVEAMTALGHYQRRGGDLSPHLPSLGGFLSAKDEALAAATAWTLSQSRGTEDPQLIEALRQSGRVGTVPLKRYAIRALARKNAQAHRAYFLNRLEDASPLVQIEAVRALGKGRVRGAVNLSQRLRLIWRRVAASHQRLTSLPLKVVVEGLLALHPHARVPTIQIFAKDLMELSDTTDSAVAYSPSQAHSIDLINCLAAQLLDLGVGRPENSAVCGHSRAKALTPAWRRILVVDTIIKIEREARWKLILLRRYLTDPLVGVRRRAVEALGELASPEIVAPVMRALKDPDVGVYRRALEVVKRRSEIFKSNAEMGPLLLRRKPTPNWQDAPLLGCRLSEAYGALRNRQATSQLSQFARSGNRGLQQCARRALTSLTGSSPVLALDTGKRTALPAPDLSWFNNRTVPTRMILVTHRGEITIELYPHLAPATVARFVELAEQRAYRDVEVTALVAGSSVLFSEVLKPAKALFPVVSEPHDLPFVRGSVGFHQEIADGGRSRFFISLERQPQLRGRATLVGTVVKGLEVVDSLLFGDRIKDLYPPK